MFFELFLPFCQKYGSGAFSWKRNKCKLSHFKLPSDITFVIAFLSKAFYKQAKKKENTGKLGFAAGGKKKDKLFTRRVTKALN